MAETTLVLDTRRPLQDGTFPVKVSVGYGTRIYISTGVSVPEASWVDGKVEGKDAKRLNSYLETRLLRVKARVLRLREDGRLARCSASHLRKLLTAPDMDEVPDEDARVTLWEIADRCIATKEGRTKDAYLYTLAKLHAFAGYGPVYVEDIDRVWLYGFEKFMGGKVNARAVHLRNLKTICNFALDEEITTFYPFRKFKIRTEETRKKDLTVEQLRAFATADITYRNDAMHRDVFMLLFYFRGMNISDLSELTWKDVRNGRVYYRRNKTGRLFSIRIEPEAQAIIDRWKGEEHLLAVFDRYKKPSEYNRRLRDALQRMSDESGQLIEPDCTSNWARHTWATLAADLDYTEEALSWGMGHKTGHRVTEIYIHRSDAKCDEANRAVIDYLKGNVDPPLQVNP